MSILEYKKAGIALVGIHPIMDEGACGCGNDTCRLAGKHPVGVQWQNGNLDGDDIYTYGANFGAIIKNDLLIIDIDPRNGGEDSYTKLVKDMGIDFKKCGTYVVKTGGGGYHIYYKHKSTRLKKTHKEYVGIDFISKGMVIGAGSLHASGEYYRAVAGGLEGMLEAPECLVNLLTHEVAKPRQQVVYASDTDLNELVDALDYIDPDLPEPEWRAMGAAIHHATGGSIQGFNIFDAWSSNGSKYTAGITQRKWDKYNVGHASGITKNTLFKTAYENGYQPARLEINLPVYVDEECKKLDVRHPPGNLGVIKKWMDNYCKHDRKNLTIGGTVTAVSALGGLEFVDSTYTDPYFYSFCIAGSGSGKQDVMNATEMLIAAGGMGATVYGGIKSDKEMKTNIVEHQQSVYVIDEIAAFLKNKKTSKNDYNQAIGAELLQLFGAPMLKLSGDRRRDIDQIIQDKIAYYAKLQEDVVDGSKQDVDLQEKIQCYTDFLEDFREHGSVRNPKTTMIGFSNPRKFDGIVSLEEAEDGFLSRCIVFIEEDPNPRIKPFNKESRKITPEVQKIVNNLSRNVRKSGRIQWLQENTEVHATPEAQEILDKIEEKYWKIANGDEAIVAIYRRCHLAVKKLSLLCAITEFDQTIRIEHVRWAEAVVDEDVTFKQAEIMRKEAEEMEFSARDHNVRAKNSVKKNDLWVLSRLKRNDDQGVTASALYRDNKSLGSVDNVNSILNSLIGEGKVRTIKTSRAIKYCRA